MPRLAGWILFNVVLLGAIMMLQPQQLSVSLYKLSLVSMAGVSGYWLDRSIFPYARPDLFIDQRWSVFKIPDFAPEKDCLPICSAQKVFAASMIRRAIIVGCAMLAIGLGA